MSTTQARKITIVGGSGTVGTPTVSALLSANIHTITALSRASSSAVFPSGVHVAKADYSNHSDLVSALRGQDVLIMQLGIESLGTQSTLIAAAAEAGVRWVLPTEFGSDQTARLAQGVPMMSVKKQFRDEIEAAGMNWVGVVNNPWFDWSLKGDFWGIDIAKKRATIYDGGEIPFNTTTTAQVGRGVAALLSLPEEKLEKYKNGFVYLSSFSVTQKQVLQSVLKATGQREEDWVVGEKTAEQVLKESEEEVKKGNHMGFIYGFYAQHLREGWGGDYREKAARDAAVLGLQEEDLDAVVKRVVEELSASK